MDQHFRFDIASINKSILININNGQWVIAMHSNAGNCTKELELSQQIVEVSEQQ